MHRGLSFDIPDTCKVSGLFWKAFPDDISNPLRFLLEFSLFIIPQLIVIVFPVYYRYLAPLTISVFAIGLLLFNKGPRKTLTLDQYAKEPRKAFVTSFRAGMMIQTMIAILGVDFSPFPRRFVKTERFGTSLVPCHEV